MTRRLEVGGWTGALLGMAVGATIVLAVSPPVNWLTSRVERTTGGRVQLKVLQGDLWQGSAQVLLFDGDTTHAVPGALDWQIRPMAWWTQDTPVVSLNHPNLRSPLRISRTPDGWQLDGSEAQFPAAWLEASGTPWNTIKPGGTVVITWPSLPLGDGFSAKIQWRDAQSALSVVKPLGNYEVSMTVSAQGILNADLQTLSGDLMLEGKANWSVADGFAFKGYASASPSQQAALTGLLSQMGRLENNRYRLGS